MIDEAGAAQRIAPKAKQKKIIGKTEIEEIISKIARIPPRSVSTDDRSALANLDRPEGGRFRPGPGDRRAHRRHQDGALGPGQPAEADRQLPVQRPTGVGKTEVARQLAYCMGIELIRFDMSEYMERHAVAPDRRAAGIRVLRAGRPAHRGRSPRSPTRCCCSTRSRSAPGHLQHPAAGDGPRHPDRQQRQEGRLPERVHRHDHQRRRRVARAHADGLHAVDQARRRDGSDQAHVHAGVPEPARRDHLVPRARPRDHPARGRQVPDATRGAARREEGRAQFTPSSSCTSRRRASTR